MRIQKRSGVAILLALLLLAAGSISVRTSAWGEQALIPGEQPSDKPGNQAVTIGETVPGMNGILIFLLTFGAVLLAFSAMLFLKTQGKLKQMKEISKTNTAAIREDHQETGTGKEGERESCHS